MSFAIPYLELLSNARAGKTNRKVESGPQDSQEKIPYSAEELSTEWLSNKKGAKPLRGRKGGGEKGPSTRGAIHQG